MSQLNFEQVMNAVRTLSPEQMAQLRELVNEPNGKPLREAPTDTGARAASLRDFSADRQWLVDHRAEYAGQWVALRYGQLIGHSQNAKEVFAAAEATGHTDVLVVLVEPPRDYPFINIG